MCVGQRIAIPTFQLKMDFSYDRRGGRSPEEFTTLYQNYQNCHGTNGIRIAMVLTERAAACHHGLCCALKKNWSIQRTNVKLWS